MSLASACSSISPAAPAGGRRNLGEIIPVQIFVAVLGASSFTYAEAVWSASCSAIWPRAILERRPVRLVTVALANKMARIAWALMTRKRGLSHEGTCRGRCGSCGVRFWSEEVGSGHKPA
jgi:hypothetical protein